MERQKEEMEDPEVVEEVQEAAQEELMEVMVEEVNQVKVKEQRRKSLKKKVELCIQTEARQAVKRRGMRILVMEQEAQQCMAVMEQVEAQA